jgi:hypothetical protein
MLTISASDLLIRRFPNDHRGVRIRSYAAATASVLSVSVRLAPRSFARVAPTVAPGSQYTALKGQT